MASPRINTLRSAAILRLSSCHFVNGIYNSMMSPRLSFARFLLGGGIILTLVSLILWWKLPLSLSFPPFLFTALLALGFGGFELWQTRAAGKKLQNLA
jgi:hypothetical protein